MHRARKIMNHMVLPGLFSVLGLISCSKLQVEDIPSTANPSAEIEKLEASQAEAKVQQIDVLSPRYFEASQEQLKEAKEGRSKNKDSEVILKYVARGKANLAKAEEVGRISRSTLEPVVEARSAALEAGAPRFLAKELSAADKDLLRVTRQIENDDLGAAKSQSAKLLQSYSDLQLRAIKETHLGEALKITEQAEKEGAKVFATRTLSETKKILNEAEKYITANRQDKAGIELQGTLALSSAKHLLDVSRQAKVMDKKDAESIVLEREAQAAKLKSAATATQEARSETARIQSKATEIASENLQLESQKRLDDMLEKAKAQFMPDEAEVYRDGQKLVVRMKKLAFPVGKADLTPGSMPLLAKLNQAIRDIDVNSRIQVQGHTDSTGNHAKNQKLSEKRADAIKAYLIANGLEANQISTIGYGDSKPIAVNKTKEGRAQNRRVDVIIEPKSPTS